MGILTMATSLRPWAVGGHGHLFHGQRDGHGKRPYNHGKGACGHGKLVLAAMPMEEGPETVAATLAHVETPRAAIFD